MHGQDAWTAYASYGVQRLVGPLQGFNPHAPFVIGGRASTLSLALHNERAYCVLFGTVHHGQECGRILAHRSASWKLPELHGERPSQSERFDATAFPRWVLNDATKRQAEHIALAVMDLSLFIAYIAESRPSAHSDQVQADIYTLLSMAVKDTGSVFLLPDRRIVIVHYSHHSADPELLCGQLYASVRRSIGAPKALSVGCSAGITVNTEDPASFGILVAFASRL